jgi:6-pyruvoyltetrahydropterin/6-carboxytetrahydropterin synthase
LHGHRYNVDITCYAVRTDKLGMVIDFGVIKEKVGKWIDETLDHNMILHKDDPLINTTIQDDNRETHNSDTSYYTNEVFGGKQPFIMADNPTAENIAAIIYTVAVKSLFGSNVNIQNVRVYETPNCWADYPGPPIQEVSNG